MTEDIVWRMILVVLVILAAWRLSEPTGPEAH